jgi:hypothetical protein
VQGEGGCAPDTKRVGKAPERPVHILIARSRVTIFLAQIAQPAMQLIDIFSFDYLERSGLT